MNDLEIKKIFDIAIKKHLANELTDAQKYYQHILEINSNHIGALNNLGELFKKLGDIQNAKNCYEKAIKVKPDFADAHNNLGTVYKKLGDIHNAKNCYDKAIEINPNFVNALYNLGIVHKELGDYQKAKFYYEKVIKINPKQVNSYNNLGVILDELGDTQKAKAYYNAAIKINPNYTEPYWNAHVLAANIDEADSILKKLYKIDNTHIKAKIMISALEGYKGNLSSFNKILESRDSEHPYTRSIKWIFSQPRLPKIFFNRWSFFDEIVSLTETSRPFYEFGVWNGVSFKYLINTFKKGYGFDTFTGIPESWHHEPKGNYSNFGQVPKIEGGEFIVGKFEDTLKKFFSKKKPLASLINFDADLYSSTICALNFSKEVIDEKTILIFDEFIMNDNWEKDEYKALNEFCNNFGFNYEVLAFSLSTKQVAVKLKKN